MRIGFGALCDPLKKQLAEQGLEDTKAELHEKINKSITMLAIHGYIGEKAKEKMRQKLFKEITKTVRPKEA
jgi:hypothetical protein